MSTAYAELVERGCLCGTERPQDCTLHGPGDNRGLAAFYKAGMPLAFPAPETCSVCGAEGLGYPNVELDDPNGSGRYKPTLICPNCSFPSLEWMLRREVEASGLHVLNDRRVFDARPYPVRDMQAMLDRGTEAQQAECKAALAECWRATEDGTDWTTDFTLGEDGRLTMSAGRAPSFALALLFDHGNFMRGERTALEWEADR